MINITKRCALIIPGHLRNYQMAKENLDEFLKDLKKIYNVDIFVSTWNKQDTPNSWSAWHKLNNEDFSKDIISADKIKNEYQAKEVAVHDDDFYGSIYSPLKTQNVTQHEYNFRVGGAHNDVVHWYRTNFLIYQGNLLKLKIEHKEQFRYDLVIKVRPDYFIQSYDVEDFKNVNDNTLYMSKNYKESVIEEQFVFGNSKTMDKYASVFLQQAGMFNEKIWGDAEYIHYLGLTKFHNINIKHLNYKVGFLYSETKNHMR